MRIFYVSLYLLLLGFSLFTNINCIFSIFKYISKVETSKKLFIQKDDINQSQLYSACQKENSFAISLKNILCVKYTLPNKCVQLDYIKIPNIKVVFISHSCIGSTVVNMIIVFNCVICFLGEHDSRCIIMLTALPSSRYFFILIICLDSQLL